MTAIPLDWVEGIPPEGLTAADYEALPEEICRHIEIVDGSIIVSPSATPEHNDLAANLRTELLRTCGSAWRVSLDVDLRIRDVPLLNYRPDVIVYTAKRRRSELIRPPMVLLVAEVMSPGSVTMDRRHKPEDYAAAGIPHFWRLEEDDEGETLTVFTYQLDNATAKYASTGAHADRLSTSALGFPIDIDLASLR